MSAKFRIFFKSLVEFVVGLLLNDVVNITGIVVERREEFRYTGDVKEAVCRRGINWQFTSM